MTGCYGNPAGKSRRGRPPREIFRKNLTGTAFPHEIVSPGKKDDRRGSLFFETGSRPLGRRVSAVERAHTATSGAPYGFEIAGGGPFWTLKLTVRT
jgi:hypothetical protein